MTEHGNESLIDKVKNALGMGAHEHEHEHEHERGPDSARDDSDRPEGWAGVDDALGGTENRPAGPDYGASGTRHPDPVSTGLTHEVGEVEDERADGWAGVDGALGGTTDRPAGPDYGAAEADPLPTTPPRSEDR